MPDKGYPPLERETEQSRPNKEIILSGNIDRETAHLGFPIRWNEIADA
jgi:hypothetical protein